MHLLRLLGTRGAAGADGPNRLVSDDGVGERFDADGLEHRRELARDGLLRLAGVALR